MKFKNLNWVIATIIALIFMMLLGYLFLIDAGLRRDLRDANNENVKLSGNLAESNKKLADLTEEFKEISRQAVTGESIDLSKFDSKIKYTDITFEELMFPFDGSYTIAKSDDIKFYYDPACTKKVEWTDIKLMSRKQETIFLGEGRLVYAMRNYDGRILYTVQYWPGDYNKWEIVAK